MDQNARQQIIDRLKGANNVLVTVSANPSVDQLAACIGLTLLLNRLGKHGTAVFSGEIPSTIEFLKPDETIEKNTDSLRDFIIALDKSKADKLRYKVEDKVVKIFITPYRTSLSDKDLEFSQGDFNVDAVLALGVHERTELDQAITAHGRILHDATVISVNNKAQGELGSINWIDLNASSLCEMLVELARGLTTDPLDAQMATAFMTGIVAETERFSNNKTSPRTMLLSSDLMSAGANQQLIANKLEAAAAATSVKPPVADKPETEQPSDGSLLISHQDKAEPEPTNELPAEPAPPAISTDESAPVTEEKDEEAASDEPLISHDAISRVSDRTPRVTQTDLDTPASAMPLQPPVMGGQFTANSVPEHLQADASTDPLSLPAVDDKSANPPLLSQPSTVSVEPFATDNPDTTQTLAGIEASVDSPHLEANDTAPTDTGGQVSEARNAVDDAIAAEPSSQPLGPIEALNAQPIDLNLGNTGADVAPPPTTSPAPEPPLEVPTEPPAPPAAPAPNPFAATIPDLAPPALPTPVNLPPSMPSPPPPPLPMPDPFGPPPDTNGVNPNIPTNLLPPSQPTDNTASSSDTPSAPPPVPPPLMPPAN